MPEFIKIQIEEDPKGALAPDQMDKLREGLKHAIKASAEKIHKIHVVKAVAGSKMAPDAVEHRGAVRPRVNVFVRGLRTTPSNYPPLNKDTFAVLVAVHTLVLWVIWAFVIIHIA